MKPLPAVIRHLLIFVVILSCLMAVSTKPARGQSSSQASKNDYQSPLLGTNFFYQVGSAVESGDHYVSRLPNSAISVDANAIWITLIDSERMANMINESQIFRVHRGHKSEPAVAGAHLRITFDNANPSSQLEPFNRLETRVSHFIGSDEGKWRSRTPAWGGLRYHELYPGIDLVVENKTSGSASILNWWLDVQPDADLSAVGLRIEGAEDLQFSVDSLKLSTPLGEVQLPLLAVNQRGNVGSTLTRLSQAPVIHYDGVNSDVFRLESPFVAARNKTELLQTANSDDLIYSTYLGGENWDTGYGVAVEPDGSAYVVGSTPSLDFPTTPGAFKVDVNQVDAFVAKLNPTGRRLDFSTFIGGNSLDSGFDITIDQGVVYLTGDTWSSDFPGTDGVDGENDAFAVALSPDGTRLIYATLLGGSDQDVGYGIAVEGGSAYVTGNTWSQDFVASGYQNNGDAFVVKLDPQGNIDYATLIGGRSEDSGFGIDVLSGEAYLTGQTWSRDFPATGFGGEDDAFVVKMDRSGELAFALLIGGSQQDSGNNIAVDEGGSVYVTGETRSEDFPVITGSYGGEGDAFLAQVSDAGALSSAIFVGGSAPDEGRGIAIAPEGNLVICGITFSENFIVTENAIQNTLMGGSDAFLTHFELSGSALAEVPAYATFLGGSGDDRCLAVALGRNQDAVLTGSTGSSDFPISSGALDNSLDGQSDAFVSRLTIAGLPLLPTLTATTTPVSTATPAVQSTPTSTAADPADNRTPVSADTLSPSQEALITEVPLPSGTLSLEMEAEGTQVDPVPATGAASADLPATQAVVPAGETTSGSVNTPSRIEVAATPGEDAATAGEDAPTAGESAAAEPVAWQGGTAVIWVVIILGLVLIAIVIWIFLKRRNHSQTPSENE